MDDEDGDSSQLYPKPEELQTQVYPDRNKTKLSTETEYGTDDGGDSVQLEVDLEASERKDSIQLNEAVANARKEIQRFTLATAANQSVHSDFQGRVEQAWPYNPSTKLFRVLIVSLNSGKRTMLEMTGEWARSTVLSALMNPGADVLFTANPGSMTCLTPKPQEMFERKVLVEHGVKFRIRNAADSGWMSVGAMHLIDLLTARAAPQRAAAERKRKERDSDKVKQAVLALEPSLKRPHLDSPAAPAPVINNSQSESVNPFATTQYGAFQGFYGEYPTVEFVRRADSKNTIGGFVGVTSSVFPPKRTTTGEYSMSMRLLDPSSKDPITCNLFAKVQDRLPIHAEVGRAILFRRMETNDRCQVFGASYKEWECCYLDWEATSDCELEYQPIFYDRQFQLLPIERKRIFDLQSWHESLRVPIPSAVAPTANVTSRATKKMAMICEMQADSWYNCVAEILYKQGHTGLDHAKARTVCTTDWTRNSKLRKTPSDALIDERIMLFQCWDKQKIAIEGMIAGCAAKDQQLYVKFANIQTRLLGDTIIAHSRDQPNNVLSVSRLKESDPSVLEIKKRRALIEEVITKAGESECVPAIESEPLLPAPVKCESYNAKQSNLSQALNSINSAVAHLVEIRFVSMEYDTPEEYRQKYCRVCRHTTPMQIDAQSSCCGQPTEWVWSLKMLVEDSRRPDEGSPKSRSVVHIVGENARTFLAGLEPNFSGSKETFRHNFQRVLSLIKSSGDGQTTGPPFKALILAHDMDSIDDKGQLSRLRQLHLFNTAIECPMIQMKTEFDEAKIEESNNSSIPCKAERS